MFARKQPRSPTRWMLVGRMTATVAYGFFATSAIADGAWLAAVIDIPFMVYLGWGAVEGALFRLQNRELIALRRAVIDHIRRLRPDTDLTIRSEKVCFWVSWYWRLKIFQRWEVTIVTPLDEKSRWLAGAENEGIAEWLEEFTIWRWTELVDHTKDVFDLDNRLPFKRDGRARREHDLQFARPGLSYADADDLRRLLWYLEGAQPISA